MPPLIRSLVVLAALGAGMADAAPVDPSAWRVARPGVVLVDPVARAAELEPLDPTERRRLCPPPHAETDPAPVTRLVGPATASGADPSAQPFTLIVMAGAAAALAGDRGGAAGGLALLARWARADALSELAEAGPEHNNANTLYSLRRVLLGVIPAWALLVERAAPAPELRRVVEAWIARRVTDADAPTGPAANRLSEPGPSNHNHDRLMREAVVMAHGALTGDAEKLRRGGQFFLATLRTMRPDGSLPLETARGARALWYQRHAVASLTFIAELASVQGYDLYAAEIDGKRLARAVEFLTGSLAEPDRVAPYAPERQDLGFLEPRPSGRNAMAWLEPWHRRAPRNALATGDITAAAFAHRPLIDEISGGNLTCLFAKTS